MVKYTNLWKFRLLLVLAQFILLLTVPIYVEVYEGTHKSILGPMYRVCITGCEYWDMKSEVQIFEIVLIIPIIVAQVTMLTLGLYASMETRTCLDEGKNIPASVKRVAQTVAIYFLGFNLGLNLVNPIVNSLTHGATIEWIFGVWVSLPFNLVLIALSFEKKPFLAADFRTDFATREPQKTEIETKREKYKQKLAKYEKKTRKTEKKIENLQRMVQEEQDPEEREVQFMKLREVTLKAEKVNQKRAKYKKKLKHLMIKSEN